MLRFSPRLSISATFFERFTPLRGVFSFLDHPCFPQCNVPSFLPLSLGRGVDFQTLDLFIPRGHSNKERLVARCIFCADVQSCFPLNRERLFFFSRRLLFHYPAPSPLERLGNQAGVRMKNPVRALSFFLFFLPFLPSPWEVIPESFSVVCC